MAECTKCGDYYRGHYDLDTGLCGHCEDIAIENMQRRREWQHYHSDARATETEKE